MSRPLRSSIGRWMLLAGFVAVDAALLRSHIHDLGIFLLVPALQAAVFLALPRRGGVRAGWLGFFVAGVVVLICYSGIRGPFLEMSRRFNYASYLWLTRQGIDIFRMADTVPFGRLLIYGFWIVTIDLPLLAIAALGAPIARLLAVVARPRPAIAE